MQFVIFGAGAIGGVVGARLAQSGEQVRLVARGDHAEAIEQHGLRLRTPDEDISIRIPVHTDPATLEIGPDSVMMVAVKSQDTEAALDALRPVVRPSTPIVCLQNGVENERRVARRWSSVYATVVMCPAAHLEPGVVIAYSSPVTGLIDIGRYPSGTDALTAGLAEALQRSRFDARESDDVLRWKYAKLLVNLVNAVDALCRPSDLNPELAERLRAEGRAVLDAAGIDYASEAEDAARRGELLTPRAVDEERAGASSWQSLKRGTGSIETDFLNGEITLLGRLHGVATPLNSVIQQVAAQAAQLRLPPATFDAADILARADAGPSEARS